MPATLTDAQLTQLRRAHDGLAAVLAAVSPDLPPPAAARPLSQRLRWKGSQYLPPDVGEFAYGGLASRIVAGKRTWLVIGRNAADPHQQPVWELADAGWGFAKSIPTAAVVRNWGDVTGGRRTWQPADQDALPLRWLLWDEPGQRLLWGYHHSYAVTGLTNPAFGYTRLGAGVANAYGPWALDVPTHRTQAGAGWLPPALAAAAGGRSLLLSGSTHFPGNQQAPWGLGFQAAAVPDDTTPAAAPLPTLALAYQPLDPALHRGRRPATYSPDPPGAWTASVPRPAGTGPADGWWTLADGTPSFVLLPEEGRVLVLGFVGEGQVWYDQGVLPPGQTSLGVKDLVATGKGIHAERYTPYWQVLPLSQIADVAAGRRPAWQLEPEEAFDALALWPGLALHPDRQVTGAVWDPGAGELVICARGAMHRGLSPYPVLHAFAVDPA